MDIKWKLAIISLPCILLFSSHILSIFRSHNPKIPFIKQHSWSICFSFLIILIYSVLILSVLAGHELTFLCIALFSCSSFVIFSTVSFLLPLTKRKICSVFSYSTFLAIYCGVVFLTVDGQNSLNSYAEFLCTFTIVYIFSLICFLAFTQILIKKMQKMSIRNIIIVLVAILFSAVNASVFSANGSENNIIIKFKPLIVVDNYKVGSPVYGIIIEDVKQEGKTVIPTGTEIIGITTKGPDRDKIYFDNQWSFIYRTPENKAGVDIKFSGDAFSGNSYSEKGFKCYLIDNTDPKDLYAISNVFMHGLDNDNKVTNEVKKILTETQNKYVEQYAEKMQETIKREGYFLRLPPGTIIAVKTKNIDILTH